MEFIPEYESDEAVFGSESQGTTVLEDKDGDLGVDVTTADEEVKVEEVEAEVEPDQTVEQETEPEHPVEPEQPNPVSQSEASDIVSQIWNAELVIRSRESVIEELKEDLKDARASYDKAIQDLRTIAQKSHEEHPLFDKPVSEQPVEEIEEPEPSTDWRLEPISVLLEPPIAGMGPKKVTALTDVISNLGDFEDLRARVGKDADTLAKLLPKGFGEKMVSELEDRQLDFIANFQNKKPSEESEAVSNDEDENLTDEERQLLKRLNELQGDGTTEWTESVHDTDAWESGLNSGNAGEEVGECIYLPGEKQDDWLRGWASANSEWEYEDDGEDSAAEAKTEEEPVASLDDL